MEKGYTFHPCADAISDCRQNSFQGHIIKNQNCFVFIRLCFNVTGILAVNGEDGVGNRAFQIAIVVFRPKEEPLIYVGHFCVAKRLRKSRKSFILYGGRRIS
ncbi:MAG: hypothetical protein HFH23_08760 [Ruminococcus sp.]|nr:hypothetical protein [Ruminococcus sp.]